jgi:hypothetical protein
MLADQIGDRGALHVAASRSNEVLAHRIERVRGQLGKNAAQTALNIVDMVEEFTAVHLQLPAAQPPIGAQQVVNPKEAMLEVFERPLADQAEIRHILFPYSRIGAVAARASATFPGDRTGVRPKSYALPKAAIASTKNGSKDAIARRFRSSEDRAHTVTVTETAGGFGKPNYVGSLPLHFVNVLLAAAISINNRRQLFRYCSQSTAALETVKNSNSCILPSIRR